MVADLQFRISIPLDDFGAASARDRTAGGYPKMLRNARHRRTESKRALLKAIDYAGGTW